MQYPLFSFEYPEIFRLVDLNLIYEEKQAITLHSDVSHVEFTVKQENLPEPDLIIRVQKQGFGGMDDANAAFKFWSLNPGLPELNIDNTSTGNREVIGIKADYLETFGALEEYIIDGHLIYPKRQRSFRGVFFDYDGLVWAIMMTWQYLDTEPPEVTGYFEHVISSFKFLE
jgi:hypothetical protein